MAGTGGGGKPLELKVIGDAGQLERELRKAASKLSKFANDAQKSGHAAARGAQQTEKAYEHAGRSVDTFGGRMRRVAKLAAGGAIFAGVVHGAKEAVDVTEELGKTTLTLHKSFGLTVESASRWAAVSRARGADGKQMVMGFKALATQAKKARDATGDQAVKLEELTAKNKLAIKQAKEMGKTGADLARMRAKQALAENALSGKVSGAAKAFTQLGISQDELVKRGNDMDWLLSAVADGMDKLPVGTDKAAIAAKLFGRTWTTIAPLIRSGSKEMEAQLKMADKYGVTFNGKTIKTTHEFAMAQRESKLATMGLQLAIGTTLMPELTKLTMKLNKVVLDVRKNWPEIKKTVTEVAAPFIAVGKAIGSVVKHNPEFGTTVAQVGVFAIAATKVSKATGMISILKALAMFGGVGSLAGAPGKSPRGTPPVVAPTSRAPKGGGGEKIPPIAPVGKFGKFGGRVAAGARKVGWTGAAGAALGAYSVSKGDPIGGALGGAVLGFKTGGPLGAVGGAAAGFAGADAVRQGRLKGMDKKTLSEVYSALKINNSEAAKFKLAMSQYNGSIASIKTGKLQELKGALSVVSFASTDAQNKARQLAGIVDRELAQRMTSKVRGAWTSVRRNTDTAMSDINRTVSRNMPRVRAAMELNSREGARTVRANFGGAVSAIETAMGRGKVSVETGMARINELLSTELKTLGVSFTWGASAGTPGLADSPLFPKAKKPKINKQGSTGVVSPNADTVGAAGGALIQIGRAGDAGHDNIPMRIAGRDIVVGSGEQAAILNRHQQAELNARTADVGGLTGFFKKFSRKHFMAGGGTVKAPRLGGSPSATRAVAQGTLDKSASKATSKLRTAERLYSPIGRMVRAMNAIDAQNFKYVYGGGHGSFSGPYDCSGLVSAVLHAGGFTNSTMTTDGLKSWGESGVGKMITIGVRGSTGRNAHTMMQIGNRYLESGSGHGAQWVDGWSGSFPIKRHPKGYAGGGAVARSQYRRLPIEERIKLGWGMAGGGLVGHSVGSWIGGAYKKADRFLQRIPLTRAYERERMKRINVYRRGQKTFTENFLRPRREWSAGARKATGGWVAGAGSWFNDGNTKSGEHGAGVAVNIPGMGYRATYNKYKLKYWDVIAPNGKTGTFRQVDEGPSASATAGRFKGKTRLVDFLPEALRKLGYSTSNFPTDATFKVKPSSKKAKQRVGYDKWGNRKAYDENGRLIQRKPVSYAYVNGRKVPVYSSNSNNSSFTGSGTSGASTKTGFLKIPETTTDTVPNANLAGGNAAAIAQGNTPGANVEGGSGTGAPAEDPVKDNLVELMKTYTQNQARLIAIAQSQPNQLLNSILDATNGGIGARINPMTPGYAGGGVRH